MTPIDDGDLSGLRRGLVAFCYQLLGSPFDAEEAAQDALERVWRARDAFDPERASLSTWAYAIARNVCLDHLRAAPRRPLPRDLQEPGIDVGSPLVPSFDVPWLMPAPTGWLEPSEVEASVERGERVRLAVTALLQTLPPTQRGAFVLRDVIGLSAAEAAEVLDVSVAAANSALQRARAAVRAGSAHRPPPSRATVERYARAIESADVPSLAALVAQDVLFEMPPVAAWSRGVDTYAAFMTDFFVRRGASWATTAISAGGLSGILLYRVTSEGHREAHTVQLFDDSRGDAIGHVLVYQDARLFALLEREALASPR